MGLKALTAAIYSRVQQHLLPPGVPWKLDSDGVLTKVLLASGDELARVSQRGVDLIDESDPRTTDELLTDFETALGLDGDAAESVAWTDKVSVTATGNTLEKTGGSGGVWDAGAASDDTAAGDCRVDFTTAVAGSTLMCGLSSSNIDEDFDTIDFAFYANGSTDIRVFESGTQEFLYAVVFAPGDLARVQRVGTAVLYWHWNQSTWTNFYTSDVESTGDLLVDCSINGAGDKIVGALFQNEAARRNAVIARMVEQQRARPIDFQEALASILGQDSGDVVVIETTASQATAQGDAKEIYRFFIYRDPALSGTYDIVTAQTEIDRIAHSHTKGHAIESIGMIVDDPFSLVDRDIIGV